MSDWVNGSSRMKWLAGGAMATWFAGVSLALFAPEGSAAAGAAASVLTVCAFTISGPVAVWSAWRLRGTGWLRRAWALIAAGLAIDVTGVSMGIVSQLASVGHASPFSGGLSVTMLGYPPVIAGVWYAAYSLRRIPDRRSALTRSLVLPVVLFLILLGAMIGPGPAMPFSIGPRDGIAIVRLAIDLFLILLPSAFCITAALQLPHSHRARTWLWLTIGSLMWAMSDVVIPLVDSRYGPVYPLMLWALGLHLIAMGASLTVDFYRAQQQPSAPAVVPLAEPSDAVAQAQ